MLTNHVGPGKVHSSSQIPFILNDLDTNTSIKHDNNLTLVQNVRRSINENALIVLELERGSIEIDSFLVSKDVQAVPPLSIRRPQSNFDGRRVVVTSCEKLSLYPNSISVYKLIANETSPATAVSFVARVSPYRLTDNCSNRAWMSNLYLLSLTLASTNSPFPLNVYSSPSKLTI